MDGGKFPEILSDSVAQAANKLAPDQGRRRAVRYRYLKAVVGERVALKEMARHYGGLAGRAGESFIAGQVVSGLDRLVEYWGMLGHRQPARN